MKSPPKVFHFEYRRSCKGQGFNEYALIIGLVVVVSVIGLGAVGLNMNQMFSNMITMDESGTESTQGLGDSPPAETASGPPLPVVIGPFPAEPVCFDGMCINLPIVTAENSVVDTTGGNGAEHIQSFSNVLAQMAEQLALAEADPDLVQLISDLALHGHDFGDHYDRVTRLSPPRTGGKINEVEAKFRFQYKHLTQYLAAHPEALPETAQFIIDLQVSQIKTFSNFLFAPDSDFSNSSVVLIHQSANTICDQGGRQCYRGNIPVATETSTEIETQ